MLLPHLSQPGMGRRNIDHAWRITSYCDSATCVEVAGTAQGVAVRDSKLPEGPVLLFTQDEFGAFVKGVKAGEFDDLC